MKKSYVVIGMGRFGTSVAERLYELGNEVLAIDTNPDKVQRMESKVTCAVVADVRDEEVLRSLGARSCDCAVGRHRLGSCNVHHCHAQSQGPRRAAGDLQGDRRAA